MATGTGSRGSGDGIHGAILATGLGSTGTLLEANLPEAGRCWHDVGKAASGTSTIQSRTARTEEGFSGCRTTGEKAGSPGTSPELRASSRTASVAHGDAPQAPNDPSACAHAEPTGELAGRSPHQVVRVCHRP